MTKRKKPKIRGAVDRAPTCPTCGNAAALALGRFGIKASCCGLWSWGGKPLVDRATHAGRIQAHAVFDALWKSGKMARSVAYARLADLMSMTREECHISLMDPVQAGRVVTLVRAGALDEDTRPIEEQPDREVWITCGELASKSGEREVHHFQSVRQAHEAGFTWIR